MPRRVVRPSAEALSAEDGVLRRGVAAIRAELGVTEKFPAEVVEEADRVAREPRLPSLDRTDLALVTIDPPGARDLDQAVQVVRRGAGFRVHYAIADVAAFVRPGRAIDRESHRRGETLYDVGDKVPLHPPALSEGACSLLPDGPRPALLWSIDVDSSGEGTDVRVERALVRSRARLDYAQVQGDLDAGRAPESLQLMRQVGLLRIDREKARGGVNLPLPDQEVDQHGGRWRLAFRTPLPVESWNAQISLLTGMAAAHLMTSGKIGVLRTLAPADPRDVAKLRRVAHALGIAWPETVGYPELIRGLDPARADHAAMLTASTTVLRGSGYAAFDGELPEQPLHSALASTYAHTTAPLRRLVDRYAGEVCVALSAGKPVPDWVRTRLPTLPETMRASANRASGYERAVFDLVEAAVLHTHVGEVFDAAVVSVDGKDSRSGQVMLTEPAVEARATAAQDLVLGSDVRVRLTEADLVRRRVRFEVL